MTQSRTIFNRLSVVLAAVMCQTGVELCLPPRHCKVVDFGAQWDAFRRWITFYGISVLPDWLIENSGFGFVDISCFELQPCNMMLPCHRQ